MVWRHDGGTSIGGIAHSCRKTGNHNQVFAPITDRFEHDVRKSDKVAASSSTGVSTITTSGPRIPSYQHQRTSPAP